MTWCHAHIHLALNMEVSYRGNPLISVVEFAAKTSQIRYISSAAIYYQQPRLKHVHKYHF